MKPTPEMLEAYKSMAVSAPDTMKDIIKAHLVANCRKYDEKLFDRCFNHLQETVMEMLGGQEAAVDNKMEKSPKRIAWRKAYEEKRKNDPKRKAYMKEYNKKYNERKKKGKAAA